MCIPLFTKPSGENVYGGTSSSTDEIPDVAALSVRGLVGRVVAAELGKGKVEAGIDIGSGCGRSEVARGSVAWVSVDTTSDCALS
jgi:hypothetical protein